MREIGALLLAQWRTNLSYRVRMLYTGVGIVLSVVPLYFVADAVQPVMADAIATEGGQAFGFILVGLSGVAMVSVASLALPRAISSGIRTGVLEALMATPTSLPRLLAGLGAHDVLFAFARAAVTLGVGWTLGANLRPEGVLPGLVILALVALAHTPFALLASALVLAFRTAGPLSQGVVLVSTLLGGAYYPTHVIPSWLESVSTFVPLTYGLRAMRGVMLEGDPWSVILPNVAALLGSGLALGLVCSAALSVALRYARRNGTLAQY